MTDDYKKVLRGGSDPLVFFKYPGAEEGAGYSTGHIMATALAAGLKDGEIVVLGANGMLPLAASRLAQLTFAPDITVIAGASGGVNSLVEPLVPSSGDYAHLIAEAVLEFQEVLWLQMAGKTDVFFAGGIQIDRHGNCNLARSVNPSIGVRGPGSAGLPWAARSRRIILYSTSHSRTVFPAHVDFVSLRGWEGPLEGRGLPELLVTRLGVFGFQDGLMCVKSLHPDVTREEVNDSTGFDLIWPEGDLPVTPEPTQAQMHIMRQFDSDGLLSVLV